MQRKTESDSSFVFDVDDLPPLRLGLVYGFQWVFVIFPAFIMAAALIAPALGLEAEEEIRFLQLTLLVSGVFTVVQTLWGHRYPLVEGPAVALVLTFIHLAPLGLPTIQGGMMLGGVLLTLTVLSRQLDRLIRLFTPNVIGVILMLIAFGLLPSLLQFMTGVNEPRPGGDGGLFALSLFLVLLTATLTFRLRGFWKTISLLIGVIAGSLIFLLLGRLDFQALLAAPWISPSEGWIGDRPSLNWSAAFACACAYLAVMVNTLGSIQGVAGITHRDCPPATVHRGIFVNGIAGIACGLLGVAGTVSYSTSPGLILVNRVASRFVVTYCGVILVAAAFLPKLAAILAIVPGPVVGAALCIAMGAQVGAGISIITSRTPDSRDYFVVGLPVLIGTLVGFIPGDLMEAVPGILRVLFANGLVIGILLVLILEHLLLRQAEDPGA